MIVLPTYSGKLRGGSKRFYKIAYQGSKLDNAVMVYPQLIMIVHLFLAHFITLLSICFGLSHLIVEHFSHCKCEHIIDDSSIHLFGCFCESKCIVAHDIFQYIITTIALEIVAHV